MLIYGKKARHSTVADALALLRLMKINPENQAHAWKVGTNQGHIQDSCKRNQNP